MPHRPVARVPGRSVFRAGDRVPPIVKLTRCQSAGYERAIYRSHGERNTAPDSAAAARGFYRSFLCVRRRSGSVVNYGRRRAFRRSARYETVIASMTITDIFTDYFSGPGAVGPVCVCLCRTITRYLEVATPTAPPPFRPRLPCSYLAKSRPQPGCLPVTSSPSDSALTW